MRRHMDLQEKACEVLRLLGEVNELEKTTSRLRNELMDDWHKIDDALDIDPFKDNPIVQEMKKGETE
jgi:hypothetical protein